MTYAVCFVCQDKPFVQQRDALGKMQQAVVDGWNSCIPLNRRLEPIKGCRADRPPHSQQSLSHYGLGPCADELLGPVLGNFALFRPDMYGDRLLRHDRRNHVLLREEGQHMAQHFLGAFFALYPYGRAGVWLADQGGATQPFRLRLLEVGSVGELLQGRLEPNLVKLVRGT